MEVDSITMNCTACGFTRKVSNRLPMGWKRRGDEIFCGPCWAKQYILRAISIPALGPVEGTLQDLRATLREMWAASTQASNWMITELFAQDVRRGNHDTKMPPMPKTYLYPRARERFPQLPSHTLAALERAVSLKYRGVRYKVIWTCEQSLPSFRYPMPYPLPNRAWRAEWDGERPMISIRLGNSRIGLRLKGGPRFHRQRQAFGQIVSGDAVQGELALAQAGTDLMCKLVVWLPRQEHSGKPRSGTLTVCTDAQLLIVALNEKDERLWVYNADQVPRWVAEHRKQLQRWSEDHKAEHRPVPPFAERRAAAVQKYHNRMNSACHQAAAMIASFAARRRFAAVRYNDSVREFCPQFAWVKLRSLVAEKLDAAGIGFEAVGHDISAEASKPLPPD